MATDTSPKDPVTVKIDLPETDVPSGIDIGEAKIEDFADKVPNAVKPPPRSRTKPVGKRPTVEQDLDRLRGELQRNTAFVGLLACAKDPYGGQLLLLNKDDVIEKWIDVCRINPTIRNALLSAMDMGVYATAITSTLALVIAYLAHAGMLPNSEMVLTAVGGAGVTLPTDEQVEMTSALFGMDTDTTPRAANGRFARRNGDG
jgi:hypothetical protein